MAESMRINKYLSDAGVCSRREADRLVEQGRITIDGRPALMGEKVIAENIVCIDGKAIKKEVKKVILAFHKPKGIVCTAEKKEKNNIIDYIGYPIRIYPVGRLDKNSEGLILLTNDGDIVNKMMRSGNRHEKEYLVTVDHPITKSFLAGLSQGVYLEELNQMTRSCKVTSIDENSFRMILTQGLNRQIRRMCSVYDYEVISLKRLRVMNIELGDLPEGVYREITKSERTELMELIADSSNTTVMTNNNHKG